MNPDTPMNETPESMPLAPEPMMPESTPTPAPAVKAAAGSAIPMGPVLGVLLVVIVLALGALYVIGQMNDSDDTLETEDALIEEMSEQSTSTAISAIETDLNSTNMDAIDAELEAAFNDAEAAQ